MVFYLFNFFFDSQHIFLHIFDLFGHLLFHFFHKCHNLLELRLRKRISLVGGVFFIENRKRSRDVLVLYQFSLELAHNVLGLILRLFVVLHDFFVIFQVSNLFLLIFVLFLFLIFGDFLVPVREHRLLFRPVFS